MARSNVGQLRLLAPARRSWPRTRSVTAIERGAVGDTSIRRSTTLDRWWVRNLVSGPINGYGVLLEEIENLRTAAGPEDHRVRAVSGAETDALVGGSCHQPCFRQLVIPNLPHWRKEPEHAGAAQADPPVEELQPDRA